MAEQTLNDMMQPDHVIHVGEGGVIRDDVQDMWAPELQVGTDEDGQILNEHEGDLIDLAKQQGWELLSGWTGQYLYHGVLMHPSEYVGGDLEAHIRETPGFYCVVHVETDEEEPKPAGWVVCHRES